VGLEHPADACQKLRTHWLHTATGGTLILSTPSDLG
jgi:hypothetical protein